MFDWSLDGAVKDRRIVVVVALAIFDCADDGFIFAQQVLRSLDAFQVCLVKHTVSTHGWTRHSVDYLSYLR